jgi:glycosyl transferase family 25
MNVIDSSPIQVVSLTSALKRRESFAAFASASETRWSFFDASTEIGPSLRYDENVARRVHGRALSAGEIGAYSSHVAVWRSLLASNERQMIVFEDDVVADWPLIARLAEIDFGAMGIDYLRLFTKIPARFRKLRCPFIDRYHHLIRFTGFALGTQAYLLTRDGASRLLAHAAQISCPVDAFMDKYWQHGVPNVGLYPFPVFERFEPSTIGETRFERPAIDLGDRLRLFSHRLQERLAMVQNALGLDPDGLERALLRRLP